jgi:hypothetical protein
MPNDLEPQSTSGMTPFQKHLLYYSPSTSAPHRLTFLKSLRSSIHLGLDFPAALVLALTIRFAYASPFNLFSTPTIESIPTWKQRSHPTTPLPPTSLISQSQLFEMYDTSLPRRNILNRILDKAHIWSFWAQAADVKTGQLSRGDVEAFKEGKWQDDVLERRKSRVEGKGEVLPFTRMGPISVVGHSWAVREVLGVRVYEGEGGLVGSSKRGLGVFGKRGE